MNWRRCLITLSLAAALQGGADVLADEPEIHMAEESTDANGRLDQTYDVRINDDRGRLRTFHLTCQTSHPRDPNAEWYFALRIERIYPPVSPAFSKVNEEVNQIQLLNQFPIEGVKMVGPDGLLCKCLAWFLTQVPGARVRSVCLNLRCCYELWPTMRKAIYPILVRRHDDKALGMPKSVSDIVWGKTKDAEPFKRIASPMESILHARYDRATASFGPPRFLLFYANRSILNVLDDPNLGLDLNSIDFDFLFEDSK